MASRPSHRSALCLSSQMALSILCLGVATFGYATMQDTSSKDVRDFCENDIFKARCSYDEVIVMEKAMYGRMRLGRCVKVDMGYLGCSADVLDLADNQCSGRRSCEIRIPDPSFETTQPCSELKTYLEANYFCVKVFTVDTHECRKSRNLRVTATSGRIASLSSQDTWCGTGDSPWLIEALPGQRVNITLMDFSTPRRRDPQIADLTASKLAPRLDGNTIVDVCHKYAVLKERTPQKSTVVCGGRSRLQHVYLSNSNVVEVQIETRRDSPDFFILNYEVIGCADPVMATNMWFRRDVNEITIGCKGSSETWKRICVGNSWNGEAGNCSRDVSIATSEMRIQQDGLPRTIVATICVMVLVIGSVIVLLGVIIVRRSRQRMLDGQRHPPISPKNFVGSNGLQEDEVYLRPTNGTHGHATDASGGVGGTHHSIERCRVDTLPRASSTHPGVSYQKATNCLEENKYTHIWEMPLPIPGE